MQFPAAKNQNYEVLFPHRTFFSEQIIFDINPKSEDEINNHRRSHGDECGIDKVKPDDSRCNP